MATEIKAINEYGTGRYIIHYEIPSTCMCSKTRHTKVVMQAKKPTNAQALKLIENESDNK